MSYFSLTIYVVCTHCEYHTQYMFSLRTDVSGDTYTVKPVLTDHSKRTPKICFQNQLSLNAGQKHSAILLTLVKLPFSIKTFVLSI